MKCSQINDSCVEDSYFYMMDGNFFVVLEVYHVSVAKYFGKQIIKY